MYQTLFTAALGVCLLAGAASASSYYQYTATFDATSISQTISIAYLSPYLLTGSESQVPGQLDVLSAPGAGAYLYQGVGAASFGDTGGSAVFFGTGGEVWIPQWTVPSITAPGTYSMLTAMITGSLGGGFVATTGTVAVQEIVDPFPRFRYTETWSPNAMSDLTSFYYDSPIFLRFPVVPPQSDIHTQSPPGPGAVLGNIVQTTVGGGLAQAWYQDTSGNSWFFSGLNYASSVNIGSYEFTDGIASKNFAPGIVVRGSIDISILPPPDGAITLTPEPGTFLAMGASLIALGMLVRRRRQAGNRCGMILRNWCHEQLRGGHS